MLMNQNVDFIVVSYVTDNFCFIESHFYIKMEEIV